MEGIPYMHKPTDLPWNKYLTFINDLVVRLVALTVFEEDEDETDAVELL